MYKRIEGRGVLAAFAVAEKIAAFHFHETSVGQRLRRRRKSERRRFEVSDDKVVRLVTFRIVTAGVNLKNSELQNNRFENAFSRISQDVRNSPLPTATLVLSK